MRYLLACVVVAIALPAGAAVDYTCLNRCTAQGYQYAYCQEVCTYGQQPGTYRPSNPFADAYNKMSNAPNPVDSMIRAQNEAAARRAQQDQAAAQQAQAAAQTRLIEEQTRAVQIENQRRATELSQAGSAGAAAAATSQASPESVARWQAAAAPRRGLYPDFDSVVFSMDVPISPNMVECMASSQYAADIAYYLGKHKNEAATIAPMGLMDTAAALKDIERKVSAPAH